jgi:hypothetical protein
MRPNVEAIQSLIDSRFSGNKAAFAEELSINRSQVSLVLNNDGKGAGALFLGSLMAYCEREKMDFHEFIFLPDSVNKLTPN